jgi:hypothetical protein
MKLRVAFPNFAHASKIDRDHYLTGLPPSQLKIVRSAKQIIVFHLSYHTTSKALSFRNRSQNTEKFKFALYWRLTLDTRGGSKNFRNYYKNLCKYSYKFETSFPFKYCPCDWMQRSLQCSHCWKHCQKSSTEMLARATSDYRCISATLAKRLPFKTCFICGYKKSCKEGGRVSRGGGTPPPFFQK